VPWWCDDDDGFKSLSGVCDSVLSPAWHEAKSDGHLKTAPLSFQTIPSSLERNNHKVMNNNVHSELPRLAFSVQETAAMLNVSTKSVRRLIDRGLLSASRGLRHLRITRRSIDAYLATTSGEVV